jgi:Eukaryotic-type carbonic anhydrase
MASVTAFLEAYHNVDDWDVLNRIICAWRETEDNIREECGLPSVEVDYIGCPVYRRGRSWNTNGQVYANSSSSRKLRHSDNAETPVVASRPKRSHQKPKCPHDLILDNIKRLSINNTHIAKRIHVTEETLEKQQINVERDLDASVDSHNIASMSSNSALARRLVSSDNSSWLNYFPMLGVRTEYYYRYSGSQTIPPCYGTFIPGNNREQTNHWRIYKDPVRISHRQLMELHRLLKERIAPMDDPLRSCQPDTGAKRDRKNPNKVIVARPLQETHKAHFMTFCECDNWKSKLIEDQEWCKISNRNERFYKHPYNFATNGF